jgi:hypothetical protein
MTAGKSPENDPAVRLFFTHTWCELFIHACEADGPETAKERIARMDRRIAKRIVRRIDRRIVPKDTAEQN